MLLTGSTERAAGRTGGRRALQSAAGAHYSPIATARPATGASGRGTRTAACLAAACGVHETRPGRPGPRCAQPGSGTVRGHPLASSPPCLGHTTATRLHHLYPAFDLVATACRAPRFSLVPAAVH